MRGVARLLRSTAQKQILRFGRCSRCLIHSIMTSYSSSHRKWAAAHSALQKALQDEVPAEHPVPHGDRLQVFQDQAILYLKYLQIFRSLEEVYEQLVQPQKRRAVRMVLDGLTGRLLELKAQMVELDQSEFHYFDDLLLDLKMTPKDLEIPIPRYFLRDKMQLQRNRQMIDSALLKQRANQTVSSVQVMSLEEAIQLLQMSERARQGRIRAQFMKELIQSKRGIRRHTWRPSGLNPDQAAIQIQKVWRGFVQRRNTSRQRTEEMMFLGMIPVETSAPSPVQLQGQWVSSSQRLIQDQNEEEYQRVQLSVKQSVLDVEGTDIKEALQDQIRQWFIECRDATGRFPEFPDEEDGGSASLFSQKTPEQVSAELAAWQQEKDKKKKREGKEKKKKEKTGRSKKKKKKQPQEDESLDPSSCFLPDVVEGHRHYTDVWRCRGDHQLIVDVSLLREKKRQEVEQEVRLQVDELMRAELKNLKLVVDKTKTKAKKGNKKKKKKTKKKKDLTANRSLQSLCDELIMNGFLIQPQNVRLSEYIGEFSYLASTLRQANIEPTPSLSDVRQLVALYTVLPLGSQALLKKLPVAKSVLLAGPSGVGKKMLVQAICCETGAYLFHLSPTQLSHRYPGRGGATYLLHLVFKVAGELQPSVIWIEDAEKTFCKKKPKANRQFDPRRLMKDLLKSLKTLKPEDRVLVIGTSRRPFDAEIKPFCKVYKKVILIPKPDYGSRLALWKELLRAQGAELGPSLDLSSLAKITDGFTPGHILSAVQSVLRPQRLKKLRLQPLTAAEFVPSLSRMDPVYREEEEAFKVWFSKTPLGRRKTRASKTNKEEKGGGKAGRKKKKDKMMTKKKKKK
ncbi:dynein regulatory complex protein 11-like [Mastacembelus armatus]|uniref:dynein regulatory complex protein 11-like n=1 Tax=Mastacembelus armatus TaxID=205130 RepID=UPI000E45F352|nr:dynein regulatory complex protein 11-like [Mastacembelus armatus]